MIFRHLPGFRVSPPLSVPRTRYEVRLARNDSFVELRRSLLGGGKEQGKREKEEKLVTAFRYEDAMEPWQRMLSKSVTTAEELGSLFDIKQGEISGVVPRYPAAINPYYLGLIKKKGDVIYRQAVPHIREITEDEGLE
ncbi:MAG: hypothetical protein PVH82_17220, partial [Desulfobacteraceae bacterium]